ncbi:NAD(P)/FAD-dependent oxidoreductase [Lentisphaera profundi]|uniref:NAD(P)/FAD-dependent oxidoreductase n=1 Tax=Lentisphaera profundi TaxID=1658616 RepID=A0ABY7W194_9BACT|nr:NAD(P)/FAD-dependent oxidoreductase [Lentisphaera profundi]WDE98801.1 NAD(P)/FAD-dependent oxidoreductase [Lentisphaera profundi]
MNSNPKPNYDLIVIGGGAAGLMCTSLAAKRGKKVLLIDHNAKPGRKIIISGGGRCNFTNLNIQPDRYISQNPRFCISALKRYTQHDFIKLVKSHGLTYNEKTLGQLFCDQKSPAILAMLQEECRSDDVTMQYQCEISYVHKLSSGFEVKTSSGTVTSSKIVIASGGLSMPKIGATNFAYNIAKQFNLSLIPTQPGLVPLTLSGDKLDLAISLAGTALDCNVFLDKKTSFRENMLFTHRGLSGPAILQISSYWRESQEVFFNFLPDQNPETFLQDLRKNNPKETLGQVLKPLLPKKFIALFLCPPEKAIAQLSKKELAQINDRLFRCAIIPSGTEGYRTAEVTLGGLDTKELSSKTMEVKQVPGLYFIGEAVDVTGWLGGYNFQWAWSSAAACAESL